MIHPQMSRIAIVTLIGGLGLVLLGCGNTSRNESTSPTASEPASSTAGAGTAYKVSFRVDPDPPAGAKENTIHVALQDGNGKPISDVQVHVQLTMPPVPEIKMPEMSNGIDLAWNGTDYSGPIQITMAGGWNVDVEAKRGGNVLTKYQTKLTAK